MFVRNVKANGDTDEAILESVVARKASRTEVIVSDWLWQYSDVIRLTLALACAWLVMTDTHRVLFEEDDDGTE